MSATQEKLRSIMSGIFRVSATDFPTDPSPENVKGWDSLGHLNLIEAVEAEFGVSIPHKDAVKLLSETQFLAWLEDAKNRDKGK